MASADTAKRWAWILTPLGALLLAGELALQPAWPAGDLGLALFVFALFAPPLAWLAYFALAAGRDDEEGTPARGGPREELDLEALDLDGDHVVHRGRWDEWEVAVLRRTISQYRGPTLYRHVVVAATGDTSAFASVEPADGLTGAAQALGAGDLGTGDALVDERLEIRTSDPDVLEPALGRVPEEWRRLDASAFDTFRVEEGRVRYEWSSTTGNPPSAQQLREAARLVVDVARGLSQKAERRPPPDALEDTGVAAPGARFQLGAVLGVLGTLAAGGLAGPVAGWSGLGLLAVGSIAALAWTFVWVFGIRHRRVPTPPDGAGWSWEWPWILGALGWGSGVALALPHTGPEAVGGDDWVLATATAACAIGALVFLLVQRVQELRRTRTPSTRAV